LESAAQIRILRRLLQPKDVCAMPNYEYRVVPAPKKGERAKGVKGTEARFAHTLATVMNELGAEGWDYVRTDTLPCEERSGLTGKATSFRNLMIFRRVLESAPVATAEPEAQAEQPEEPEEPLVLAVPTPDDEQDTPAPALSAATDTPDHNAPALGPATDAPTSKDSAAV